jgi:hypothetical protein
VGINAQNLVPMTLLARKDSDAYRRPQIPQTNAFIFRGTEHQSIIDRVNPEIVHCISMTRKYDI